MRLSRTVTLRTRLTMYYVGVLAVLLLIYAGLVFGFQSASLTRQMVHDEVQDVITVEGLLYFDAHGQLQLRQDYYSRPQSHMLVDRLMEVRDASTGEVLYSSPTLHGMSLGNELLQREGDTGFDERRVKLADGSHVFVVSHVHGLEGRTMVLRLGYSLTPFRERMWSFLLLLLLAIPIALALAAIAGQAIARRALHPLGDMTEKAERISAHNLSERLEVVNERDELGQMALVFNGLLQRLEQAFQQLHRFTADAAHELRTPLAALRAVGEVALHEERSAEEYRSTLSNVLEEASRLNMTIDSLLMLARAEASESGEERTSFSMRSLVDEVLGLLEVLLEEKTIHVAEVGERTDRTMVLANRSLLRVAVMNVLHNAIKFSPTHSTLHIGYATVEEPMRLTIAFEDEGPGIPEGDEQRLFERFATGSAAASAHLSGTGLGLAIARLIVERAGGSIYFDRAVSTGARCVIVLPFAS
jgi:heavy metal sensor kinase